MAIVPSWQQLPPQHAAIQQPLLSDAGDWGRPLIVDSSAILQVVLVNKLFVIFSEKLYERLVDIYAWLTSVSLPFSFFYL